MSNWASGLEAQDLDYFFIFAKISEEECVSAVAEKALIKSSVQVR
jgi:hypothetical protein